MPFEHIAGSSPTLQLPSSPTVTSINIPRPIVDTPSIVEHATNSINQILQQMSPAARLQRQIQMLQLQAQQRLYMDYQAHPDKYRLTMNGPVPEDPWKVANEIALFKTRAASLAKSNEAATATAARAHVFDNLDKIVSGSTIAPQNAQAAAVAKTLPVEHIPLPEPPDVPVIPDESQPDITPPTDTAQVNEGY